MEELQAKDFSENVVLVNLTDTYEKANDAFELYEAARGYWVMNKEKAERCDLVMAVHEGNIIEVYRAAAWFEAGTTMRLAKMVDKTDPDVSNRREFVGNIAEAEIRDKFIGKNVQSLFEHPKQNPVRYIMGGVLTNE